MWFNILKVQESITDLGLDFESPDEKLEPKDKDSCCEEAKNKWKASGTHYSKTGYDNLYTTLEQKKRGELGGYANKSCKEFKAFLSDFYAVGFPDSLAHRIFKQWEECENE
jgi:hypothetical protein